MMELHRRWRLAASVALGASCWVVLTLGGCSSSSSPEPSAQSPDALADAGRDVDATAQDAGDDAGPSKQDSGAGAGGWTFETIEERKLTSNGNPEDVLRVELVRAHRPDGGRSYLLYQHAPTLATGAPLLIATEPYAVIDWTGEDVDTRWSAQGGVYQPDVDAPNYNGKDIISVPSQSVQAAVDANRAWIANGFATIRAYGRFYAGGSLEDDVLDSVAPYYFAKTRAGELDLSRIGAYGGSWGAMMALFGARRAPPEVAPRAVVALSAPSDFVDLWQWSKSDLPAAYPNKDAVTAFYSPYWHRSLPTLGDPPVGAAATPFTHAGLCPGLPGKILAMHDAWDLIIPVRQTEQLTAACANVEPLYWRRAPIDYATAKIDHGPYLSEGTSAAATTFALTFLAESLAPPDATLFASAGSQPSLQTYFDLVLAEQRAGHEVGYVLPRLRELAEPRLKVLEIETSKIVDGADLLARAVNAVWKTAYDGPGVRAQVAKGLPTPP